MGFMTSNKIILIFLVIKGEVGEKSDRDFVSFQSLFCALCLSDSFGISVHLLQLPSITITKFIKISR